MAKKLNKVAEQAPKRAYNKKPKAPVEQQLKEESKCTNCVPLDALNQISLQHNAESARRIAYHLERVKETTGETLPEDTAYVIALSQRELVFKLKAYAADNVL
jgi:hypothetical protein